MFLAQPASLFEGLFFVVLIIRGLQIVYEICYSRIIPLLIRGFLQFLVQKVHTTSKADVPCHPRFKYSRNMYGTKPLLTTVHEISLYQSQGCTRALKLLPDLHQKIHRLPW